MELARPYSTQLVAVCASPTDAIRGIAVHLIGQLFGKLVLVLSNLYGISLIARMGSFVEGSVVS